MATWAGRSSAQKEVAPSMSTQQSCSLGQGALALQALAIVLALQALALALQALALQVLALQALGVRGSENYDCSSPPRTWGYRKQLSAEGMALRPAESQLRRSI